MPPRRSPLVLRLFALALADGSGLPFSLHPPPAALESQTPQREPRRLRRRARRLSRRGQGSRERVQFASVATPYQNVRARRTLINILPQSGKIFHTRKARISPRRKARFHTVSRHTTPYFTAAHSGAMCRHSLVSSGSKREWRYRKSRQSGSENTAVHTACGAITV